MANKTSQEVWSRDCDEGITSEGMNCEQHREGGAVMDVCFCRTDMCNKDMSLIRPRIFPTKPHIKEEDIEATNSMETSTKGTNIL